MATDIVKHDVQVLLDGWMELERNGVKFPVPFDAAWAIAGYARKSTGKRGMRGLKEGRDICTQVCKTAQGGRSSESISLSCDAFKHFCLTAGTDEGEAIRCYFIEAEKKWKLVQQVAPQFAEEIELIHAKQELAKLEAQRTQAELQLVQFRHIVTTTMPEPIQQKILGYSEVTTIEYRDRIVHNDDVINDGSTILKTDLCRRYGILTRNGKPDYKRLNQLLDQMPPDSFVMSVRLQDNYEFRRECLPMLDRLAKDCDRNRWIGE